MSNVSKEYTICMNCMVSLPIDSPDDDLICPYCERPIIYKKTNCDPVLDFFQQRFNKSRTDFAYDLIMPPATMRWHAVLAVEVNQDNF